MGRDVVVDTGVRLGGAAADERDSDLRLEVDLGAGFVAFAVGAQAMRRRGWAPSTGARLPHTARRTACASRATLETWMYFDMAAFDAVRGRVFSTVVCDMQRGHESRKGRGRAYSRLAASYLVVSESR